LGRRCSTSISHGRGNVLLHSSRLRSVVAVGRTMPIHTKKAAGTALSVAQRRFMLFAPASPRCGQDSVAVQGRQVPMAWKPPTTLSSQPRTPQFICSPIETPIPQVCAKSRSLISHGSGSSKQARGALHRHDLPGLGVPNGHGGRSMLPESQQPLQRPP